MKAGVPACLAFAIICSAPGSLFASLELGTPFADNMVLQRGCKIPVWGMATPDAKVTVKFADQAVSTKADRTGRWMAMLPKMDASKKNRTLEVVATGTSGTEKAEVVNVLVGEVWMCAGQSNANCPIWGANPHYRERLGVPFLDMTMKPFVRLVKTDLVASATPRYGYRAKWIPMTPQTLNRGKMSPLPSAVGYLFALELANALDIPVGLVDSSWGGTCIDTWTPPAGYEGLDSLKDIAAAPLLSEEEFKKTNPNGRWFQQRSALWNGMVAAYAPMALRGLVWYQGCNDNKEYKRYCDKMHALYNGWSREFRNPEMKLYFAQLAPWGDANIPNIQMAQATFAAEEKNAGMAVINDVGCLTDIHPADKLTVAKRLALHALKRDYGFDWITADSPTLRNWKVENGTFVLSFNDARGWYLYNPDWRLDNGFEVCGTNGVWCAAELANLVTTNVCPYKSNGIMKGAELVIRSPQVAEPKQLRYLHSRPWRGSLYSDAGLPLGAFAIGGDER